MGKGLNSPLANTIVGWVLAIGVVIMFVVNAPKGYFSNHWHALWGGHPAAAYGCLDEWRDAFNDPEAVYVFDAQLARSVIYVEVRGKNKMGAWVKGEITCALDKNGDVDTIGTLNFKLMKMARPADGEVPP